MWKTWKDTYWAVNSYYRRETKSKFLFQLHKLQCCLNVKIEIHWCIACIIIFISYSLVVFGMWGWASPCPCAHHPSSPFLPCHPPSLVLWVLSAWLLWGERWKVRMTPNHRASFLHLLSEMGQSRARLCTLYHNGLVELPPSLFEEVSVVSCSKWDNS